MVNNLEAYTGILKYHNIEFSFVFDKQELRLIPPADRVREIEQWFMIHLGRGMHTLGNTVYIEDDFLVGKTNETGQTIIFIPSQRQVGRYNSVLLVSINAYIIKKYNRQQIDRMAFTSAELDCIYPVEQAICRSEWSEDGVISLSTKKFDETTTEGQEFSVNNKTVKVQFTITRTTSSKIGQPPLSLHSTLLLEFEATDDYKFLYHLWKIVKNFIQYLCYRKNINIPQIRLSSPHSEGKHEYFADFFVIEKIEETEPEILEKGRYIKQQYISGLEGKILASIAEDTIYLRHLPQTYRIGRSIDAARFVMITAAFEWEFKKTYPNGVRKKESSLVVEKAAAEAIEVLFQNSSGKLRDKYRYLKKRVKDDSLQSEIEQVGTDFAKIIDIFGNRLYNLNGEKLVYSKMGKRLGDQRNHFAHGDLDKDFIGASLLDLIYLEYIVYAMQLKRFGGTDENIQKVINELFKCGLAL